MELNDKVLNQLRQAFEPSNRPTVRALKELAEKLNNQAQTSIQEPGSETVSIILTAGEVRQLKAVLSTFVAMEELYVKELEATE